MWCDSMVWVYYQAPISQVVEMFRVASVGSIMLLAKLQVRIIVMFGHSLDPNVSFVTRKCAVH